tara:strand:+ start:48148 stop:49185 length:1038 start_codon:yes stop_codon:yes gene_type:complete
MPLIKQNNDQNHCRVIITTPDYPPKLGGLATFSANINSSLKDIGITPDIFVWKSLTEFKELNSLRNYDFAFHVHYLAGQAAPQVAKNNINFVHGSEILFYSPNPIKNLIKKLLKNKTFGYFKNSYLNIFISNITREKFIGLGYQSDCARDIIFHNCIDIKGSSFQAPDILNCDELVFTCIARDVPHKNLDGAVQFIDALSKQIDKKITLNITALNRWSNKTNININSIKDVTDDQREEILKNSHFNLLLSLDHSKAGFYEGFGLTILEAGKYGVPSIVSPFGGLVESVHDNETGWVLDSDLLLHDFQSVLSSYNRISRNVYEHTISSHSLSRYNEFFKKLLKVGQ